MSHRVSYIFQLNDFLIIYIHRGRLVIIIHLLTSAHATFRLLSAVVAMGSSLISPGRNVRYVFMEHLKVSRTRTFPFQQG